MKVDRLVMAVNNNPTYTGFWNVFSPILKRKFNLIPTLIFVGTEEELNNNNFSTNFGEIIRVDRIDSVVLDPKLDWSVPWSVFWAISNKFPEDVCMTQGIDQLPLSNMFFDTLNVVDEEKFVIGFADAYNDHSSYNLKYRPNNNFFFPTSHLVGKGKLFKKIYKIENDWREEITKVFEKGKNYKIRKDYWGLDECYGSDCIYNYFTNEDPSIFNFINGFKFFESRRIDRSFHFDQFKCFFDPAKLSAGYYSELHSPRPYNQYKEQLKQLLELL